MNTINLKTLQLIIFNKNNFEHIAFLKSLNKDETILKRFQGLSSRLLHNYGDDFFDRSFFIGDGNKLVGFINIGAWNEIEKSVYLKAAISKTERGKGYGKQILNDVTEYIFLNYEFVESIKLKIANDNKASINTAGSCGYEWLEKDYYIKYNPYYKQLKRTK